MRVVRPPLALVDVAEQEQRLRFDLSTTQLGRLLRHLEQLVGRFLELAELHRHVRPLHAQLHAQVGVLVAEQVEGSRVVAMRLAQALAPLGAAARFLEHGCGLAHRRFDRASRDLAREQAGLLEVPRDDLHELVALLGRLFTHSVKPRWSCARSPFGTWP